MSRANLFPQRCTPVWKIPRGHRFRVLHDVERAVTVIMVAVVRLAKYDLARHCLIWQRDRRSVRSPNSSTVLCLSVTTCRLTTVC